MYTCIHYTYNGNGTPSNCYLPGKSHEWRMETAVDQILKKNFSLSCIGKKKQPISVLYLENLGIGNERIATSIRI